MACYNPAVQVHPCYLNPREKVHRNFDNTFQLVDLWLANETAFEKTKDKIQVAVKDKDLNTFRVIEKCIFHGSIKSCCNEIGFVNTCVFLLLIFVSLFIFPYSNTKYFKLIYFRFFFL